MKLADSYKPGWYFKFYTKKIHYYYNQLSLCGTVTIDPNKHHLTKIGLNDFRVCKKCVNTLATYDDLKNFIRFPKPPPIYSLSRNRK